MIPTQKYANRARKMFTWKIVGWSSMGLETQLPHFFNQNATEEPPTPQKSCEHLVWLCPPIWVLGKLQNAAYDATGFVTILREGKGPMYGSCRWGGKLHLVKGRTFCQFYLSKRPLWRSGLPTSQRVQARGLVWDCGWVGRSWIRWPQCSLHF